MQTVCSLQRMIHYVVYTISQHDVSKVLSFEWYSYATHWTYIIIILPLYFKSVFNKEQILVVHSYTYTYITVYACGWFNNFLFYIESPKIYFQRHKNLLFYVHKINENNSVTCVQNNTLVRLLLFMSFLDNFEMY